MLMGTEQGERIYDCHPHWEGGVSQSVQAARQPDKSLPEEN